MAKFDGQIWQFWKISNISETTALGVKIISSSPPWGRKRVYVQLLELWPMAQLVLKQSVKDHGPLVIFVVHVAFLKWYSIFTVSHLFYRLRENSATNERRDTKLLNRLTTNYSTIPRSSQWVSDTWGDITELAILLHIWKLVCSIGCMKYKILNWSWWGGKG